MFTIAWQRWLCNKRKGVNEMEYCRLSNGMEMPMLGLGTFLTQGEECANSVCMAIRNGYRLIDTAEAYGNEVICCEV